MTWIFAAFAAVAAVLGWLFPYMVHRLGYRMALVYLTLAVIAALIRVGRRRA